LESCGLFFVKTGYRRDAIGFYDDFALRNRSGIPVDPAIRRNDEPVIRTIDERNQRGSFDASTCH
jgi:hypothetical protein